MAETLILRVFPMGRLGRRLVQCWSSTGLERKVFEATRAYMKLQENWRKAPVDWSFNVAVDWSVYCRRRVIYRIRNLG